MGDVEKELCNIAREIELRRRSIQTYIDETLTEEFISRLVRERYPHLFDIPTDDTKAYTVLNKLHQKYPTRYSLNGEVREFDEMGVYGLQKKVVSLAIKQYECLMERRSIIMKRRKRKRNK